MSGSLPPLLQEMPPTTAPWKQVVLKPGQTIFSQGDACNRVYCIDRGIVKLSTVSRKGKSAVVSILGPGDLLGVECLTGAETHQTTAVALVRATAFRMRSSLFMRLLRDHPANAAQFIDYLLKRFIRVERDLINYLVNNSEKRLARALFLMDQYGRDVDPTLLQTLTQETLADIVGTTRSRVNFFMNQFRKKGYIEYDEGGLRIHPSLKEVFY